MDKIIKKHIEISPDGGGQSGGLGELCPISELRDNDEYEAMYSTFNEFCLELTISPKSSDKISNSCVHCGQINCTVNSDEQHQIMSILIAQLVTKYKLNILTVFEKYMDGINIHSHSILCNVSDYKKKQIKKYIQDYYQLYNPTVVRLTSVNSINKYKHYMKKSIDYTEYKPIAYTGNDVSDITKKYIQQQTQFKRKYFSEFDEHMLNCTHKNCRICQWIQATAISGEEPRAGDKSEKLSVSFGL